MFSLSSHEKNLNRSIVICVLWDACHKLFCIFSGFLCVRDAGHRGDKITEYHYFVFIVSGSTCIFYKSYYKTF